MDFLVFIMKTANTLTLRKQRGFSTLRQTEEGKGIMHYTNVKKQDFLWETQQVTYIKANAGLNARRKDAFDTR